jgi:hypothetical protein
MFYNLFFQSQSKSERGLKEEEGGKGEGEGFRV